MARFTSIHPLQLTDPKARFQPEGNTFVLESDDEAVIAAVRGLPAGFEVIEDVEPDIEQLTVPELDDYAERNDIDLAGATRKADKLDAIRGHYEALAEQVAAQAPPVVPVDPDTQTTPATLESQPVEPVVDTSDAQD